jgi:hypothetical protein
LGLSSTRCQGTGSITYTATAANSTGISYGLDAASITAGNTINTSSGAVTFTAGFTGSSVITATATGCNGPVTASHTVTSNGTVEAPIFTLGLSSSRCQGSGSVSYSATAVNSTGISYALDAASLSSGNSINTSTGSVSYAAGWTGVSTITATASGCNGPISSQHEVTISASVTTPVFGSGNSSSRCQGSQLITYSATASNATSIQYFLDASSTSAGNSINISTGEVTFAAGYSGSSVITATASGCNGPKSSTHTVTTIASVQAPVFSSGVSSVRCQGNGNVNYTASAANSTSLTYSLDNISLLAGNTINSGTGRVNYTSTWSGDAIITATAEGCNGPVTTTHTATSSPPVSTPVFLSGTSSTRCQGAATISYPATSANATGMSYSLNFASILAGNTINSSTGDVTFTNGWSGTTIITASASGCDGPKTATHTVTVSPTVGTPVFSSGASSSRCQSAGTVSYSATASNSTSLIFELDAVSLGAGNTINATNGSVTFISGWNGVSTITATATGCNGPKESTHTITTNKLVETPIYAAGGSSTRCQGSGNVSYSATAENATSISYSIDAASSSAGNSINSSSGTLSYAAGWSGTTIITATAQGCSGPLTATHTVTVQPTVISPVFTLGANSSRCEADGTVIYTATASNYTSFAYSLDAASLTAGNTINTATGEVTFLASWNGTSIITATVTGCSGPKSTSHTVNTAKTVETPIFDLGGNSTRCQGANSVTYNAVANNSTSILYSIDGTSSAAGNTINSSTGRVTFVSNWVGNTTVTATAYGCYGPTTASHTISSTASVTKPVFGIGGTSTRCQGVGSVSYAATANNATSLTYTLDGISSVAGNTINSTTGLVNWVAGWSGNSTIVVSAQGCNGPQTSSHLVTITPTVGLPVFAYGNSSVRCQSAGSIIYSASSTNSTGMTYDLDAVSKAFGNTINTATGEVTFLASWIGDATVTATATGCNGPRSKQHIIKTIFIQANDDTGSGVQGSPINIAVLNNDLGDVDPLKVNVVVQPSNGFIQVDAFGVITYLPNGNFHGTDAFTYSVCSSGSSSCCSQATVTVQVAEGINDPCTEATQSKLFYLPFPESTNELREALWSAASVSYLTNSVRTVVSIKVPYPGNIITYDHWEDGYENDISIPVQSTTEVWGDGKTSNGWAPGYPNDVIPAGGYILIDNQFDYNPRNASEIFFDGKDKILSSSDIAISKISGDAGQGGGNTIFDVQSVKTNVVDITRFGKFFVIPFGEDNTLGGTVAFKYTGVFARAMEDNTIINLDYNADGNVDISSSVLNEGDVWFYDGTASTPGVNADVNQANDIKSGAILTSNKDFGVDVIFGDIASFGTRNLALFPGNFYGDVYFSPAHTTLSAAPVYAFFTNNLASPITIDWNAGTGTSGSFVIAAKGKQYLSMSESAAYKFKSRNGEAFTAVAIFDADNDGSAYDWSFNMIPETRLSSFASIAWAPGSSNLSGNYNPVWVTAPTATTLYIKYDGNLTSKSATISPCGMPYDIAVPVAALQSYKILDTDNDQSGLAVFTCDGTKIAAVWGQNPNGAPAGTPGIDVGYVMEPRCLQQLIVANDDQKDTEPDTPVIIDIQQNDYGFLCTPNPYSIVTLGLLPPSNGTIVINPNGSITYTPNPGFQGQDEFEYRICSIEYPGICDVALVKIRVSDCLALPTENLIKGKIFIENLPDDGVYNNEVGVAGIKVDLFIDVNCNGVIDSGDGVTESTYSDLNGIYNFSTKNGNNAKDDFDPITSFSGNDGGLNWNSSWAEVGDDGVLNSGDIRILNDASTGGLGNAIRLSGAANGINRTFAFTDALGAQLKFSYRRQALNRQSETVIVTLNGVTIFTLNDGGAVGTDLNYHNIVLPLSGYNANGINTLQFITNGSTATDDYFWIDNVELTYWKNPPICYIMKIDNSTLTSSYSLSLLNKQTASFTVLGVCEKDNNLGVLANLVASDDSKNTSIDTPVIINVLNNDVVGKPKANTVTTGGALLNPMNGTVTANANGTVTYTPNPGFTGINTFEYRVCSAEDPAVCDIALVT